MPSPLTRSSSTGASAGGGPWRSGPADGYTLVDLLVVVAVIAVLGGLSVPPLTAGLEGARARAAARYLAGRMNMARADAVGRSATVALRLQTDAQGVVLTTFVDGNWNGVRTTDIAAGVDRQVDPPTRLEHLFPGVIIGVPAGASESAVTLGGTNLLSFTPRGTATSGSVYVLGRDGSRFAVRILGATGRVRLQRLDAGSGQWLDIP